MRKSRGGAKPASVTITATYDAQDRLLTYGDFKFTYNANGDLESRAESHGRRKTAYSYDVMGNLKSVALPDGKTIEYLVDGQNRRVGRKVNGRDEIFYVYDDQSRLTAELDSKGAVVSRFVYGTKTNIPDYFVKENKTYKIISDHLGSPILIVNTRTGKIAESVSYDEFGRVLESQHPGLIPFGFAGCLYDSDTHLCRFGARDYDAEVGRWTTRDPLLFNGGDTNLYGYVVNDPVNKIDPNGRGVGTGVLVCGLVAGTIQQYNAQKYAQAYANLLSQYQANIAAIEAKATSGCLDQGDAEIQESLLTSQFQQATLNLSAQYLTPSWKQVVVGGLICIAAILN